MSVDKLREHDERVSEIENRYRWRLLELNEMMAQAVRNRQQEIDKSWEIYLESQGKKNCICSDDVTCAFHGRDRVLDRVISDEINGETGSSDG